MPPTGSKVITVSEAAYRYLREGWDRNKTTLQEHNIRSFPHFVTSFAAWALDSYEEGRRDDLQRSLQTTPPTKQKRKGH